MKKKAKSLSNIYLPVNTDTAQRNPYQIELISIAWLSPRKFALDHGTMLRFKVVRAVE